VFVDDFAGSQRAEHAALKQIVFGPLAGLSDGRRFAPCSFVFEKSFEHTDRGMERRAPTLGCFAVPAPERKDAPAVSHLNSVLATLSALEKNRERATRSTS